MPHSDQLFTSIQYNSKCITKKLKEQKITFQEFEKWRADFCARFDTKNNAWNKIDDECS